MARTLRNGLGRRDFLRTVAAGSAALAAPSLTTRSIGAPAAHIDRQPNLIFIHTDQQHASAISSLAPRFDNHDKFSTPHMDRLAARSVVFQQSYSANPVCCPARSCWFTGRASCEHGVEMNSIPIRQDIPDLGQWFSGRGYETHYAGKWHIPQRPLDQSFNVLTAGCGQGEHGDAAVSRSAEGFLHNYSNAKPFFLSLGFLQPHDICYWVMANHVGIERLPYSEIADELPELPANFEFDAAEPETFQKHMRARQEPWNELQWRYYLWSYYRHVEMVDAEIGRILDALDASKFAENTVVVFSADHGEGMARHHMTLKGYLYDEAARVPLMISTPGGDRGRVDAEHLVSGLDLAPTLCDLAGVENVPKARGRSLRPLLEEQNVTWRDVLVSESFITGRMLRTPTHKLIRYAGDETKQMFDVRVDPGETKNLARESSAESELAYLERQLDDWESHLEPAPEKGVVPAAKQVRRGAQKAE